MADVRANMAAVTHADFECATPPSTCVLTNRKNCRLGLGWGTMAASEGTAGQHCGEVFLAKKTKDRHM